MHGVWTPAPNGIPNPGRRRLHRMAAQSPLDKVRASPAPPTDIRAQQPGTQWLCLATPRPLPLLPSPLLPGCRQETHCRLCDGTLPPWQDVVERICKERLPSLNISDAVIDVSIQGHNFSFPSGGHLGGKDLFVEQICREGGLDSTLSLEFQCCDPLDGSVIMLKGLGALHASVFCATINAAARRARNKAAAAAAAAAAASAAASSSASSHSSGPAATSSERPAQTAATPAPSAHAMMSSSPPSEAAGSHVLTRSTSAPPCTPQRQGLSVPPPMGADISSSSDQQAAGRVRTNRPNMDVTGGAAGHYSGGCHYRDHDTCTGCRVLDVYNNYLRRVVATQATSSTAPAPTGRYHHHSNQGANSSNSSSSSSSSSNSSSQRQERAESGGRRHHHHHHHHHHQHHHQQQQHHHHHQHSRHHPSSQHQRRFGEEEGWLANARRERDRDTEAHRRMMMMEEARAAAAAACPGGGRSSHGSSLLAKCKQSLRRVLAISHSHTDTPSWL
eukprot:jgi/Mesvir1/1229/Mv17713-RA.3